MQPKKWLDCSKKQCTRTSQPRGCLRPASEACFPRRLAIWSPPTTSKIGHIVLGYNARMAMYYQASTTCLYYISSRDAGMAVTRQSTMIYKALKISVNEKQQNSACPAKSRRLAESRRSQAGCHWPGQERRTNLYRKPKNSRKWNVIILYWWRQ